MARQVSGVAASRLPRLPSSFWDQRPIFHELATFPLVIFRKKPSRPWTYPCHVFPPSYARPLRVLDEHSYVEASVPKNYRKQVLSRLKVNASNQALSQLSPFYYDLGVNLSLMTMDPELVQVRPRALSAPFPELSRPPCPRKCATSGEKMQLPKARARMSIRMHRRGMQKLLHVILTVWMHARRSLSSWRLRGGTGIFWIDFRTRRIEMPESFSTALPGRSKKVSHHCACPSRLPALSPTGNISPCLHLSLEDEIS